MPTYVYRNKTTGETFEVIQSIKDNALTHDDIGNEIERIPQVPMIIIDNTQPKTLGSLAEKNTQKMIQEGDSRIKPKKEKIRPWWRPNKDKPINTAGMSKEKIKKYIMEGKK